MELTKLWQEGKEKIVDYGHLVMFSHTIFSLPFALISIFLASQTEPNGLPPLSVLILALVALVAGRNGANGLNRWVDREMDRKNPRTKGREVPSGKVSERGVLIFVALCYLLFLFAAAMINNLTLILAPVALILFSIYSYTKRFTWLCHLILGFICGGAAVGGWVAVTGSFALTPFVLAAVIMFWTAGFDTIYATQDIAFDREEGVFSIPSRFGLQGALWIARILHIAMVVLLIGLFWLEPALGWGYGIALGISIVLLCIEHWVIEPNHSTRMDIAAYHINQIISPLLLVGVLVDLFVLGRG